MKKEISVQDRALGSLIREKRKEKNLTGAQVGDHVGVSKSAISRWEKGEVAGIQLPRLDRLCKLLEMDPLLFINKDDGLIKRYIEAIRQGVEDDGVDLSGINDEIIDKLILEALKRRD